MADHPVEFSFKWLNDEARLPKASSSYAKELVQSVSSCREEIDQLIQKYAPAWPVEQLPAVDRNILRLALYEIRFGAGIPHKVAINEAVELAKAFGSESSPKFINGVLGSLMDDMEIQWSDGVESPVTARGSITDERK